MEQVRLVEDGVEDFDDGEDRRTAGLKDNARGWVIGEERGRGRLRGAVVLIFVLNLRIIF